MHIQKLEDGSILLTAPVMIPGRPDCDFNRGEPPLTRDEVRHFKESYEHYRFLDSEHELTKTGRKRGHLQESLLLSEDTSMEMFDGSIENYPRGTWMMTGHVTDKEAIAAAEKGLYTGWSPSVRSRETADKYLELLGAADFEGAESLKSQSQSGLIKDIPNPVVLSVSLVRKPCQTGSKYCRLKDDGKMSDDNVKSKVLKALGMSEEADVEALKSQVDTLESKIEELKSDNQEALKSMKEELISEFTEVLTEFADKSQDEDDEDEEDTDSSESEDSQETNSENNDSEEEEAEEEEETQSRGSGSKQGKNHNGADKSQTVHDTYEFLGRNPDGTRKRK